MNIQISRCPTVLRHDFPDEMMNYIDEKMDEGQYKKRFRYDRPDIRSGKTQILNMNSQDIFQKIYNQKKEYKEERFRIKPKQKIDTSALHRALLLVKKQKEILDEELRIADKAKQVSNENDICMLANQGAVKYILSQNITIVEQPKPKRVPRHTVKIVREMEEETNFLSVEGLGYSLAVSQAVSNIKRANSAYSTMRPQTATTLRSTLRPASSTKNYSERFTSEQLLGQYVDLRNQLYEKINEDEDDSHSQVMVKVGNPAYLSPSQSQLGLRGGKVPPGFMPKGLKRIHSAAINTLEVRPLVPPSEMLYQRPQTAVKKDHLHVRSELKHQEDVKQLKQSFDVAKQDLQTSLQVSGNKRIQSGR